ncbi:Protein CBG26258 [Caenorhabditis briggsae]|uniref:Protein CBG26258 n=1 Tax=Caenorhabditis briggsae TaxID=6238 RepID=B6ILX9_CAEBR|nr:Protein CBG26258 [Caenorhabditis briggsae]CAS00909.1 Protein CBG26258 [Caenorhabditis briggsae]
MLKYFYIF